MVGPESGAESGLGPLETENVSVFFAPLLLSCDSIETTPVVESLPVEGNEIRVAIHPLPRSSAKRGVMSGLLYVIRTRAMANREVTLEKVNC